MKIDIPVIVKNFNMHGDVKNTLLDLLENQNYTSVEGEDYFITKSDWCVDVGFQREYWNFLYPYLWPIILDVCKNNLHYPDKALNAGVVLNYWFQQYHKNDSHGWHRHDRCSLSAVYFVELPENKATEFKLPQSTETYCVKAKEGDLVFFPSCLVHRSPINTTNKRKTIISFNIA